METSWKAQVAFVSVVVSTAIAPASAAVLTEADAVRLFLAHSPQARRVPLAERSVAAALRVDSRVPNPEVAYQVEDAGGVRDAFLTVQQALPITGRRGLLEERAEVAARAAGLAAAGELLGNVHDLRRAFHEVVYRRQVLERLRDGVERLGDSVRILERRESEGEGSGYDVLRARQELAELGLATTDAEAELAAARAHFGAFFDADLDIDASQLQADWSPSGPAPGVADATAAALEQRLDLRALATERRRFELERTAARRRRIPQPVLTAGWKRTEALGLSDSGYVAAVTVPLPVFDRGTIEAARAATEGERVELELELLRRRIEAEVQAALARERAAGEAAAGYGADAERRASELHSIARLRYDEGEGSIVELLDAHRTSLDMRLRALATRYRAKSAEIDRMRVVGNEVTP